MSRASALDPVTLRVFNALEPDAAAEVVAVWAAIPGWVDAVVAGRPYDTVDALAARAYALLLGRSHELPEDVQALFAAVAAHRLVPEAEAASASVLAKAILHAVPVD